MNSQMGSIADQIIFGILAAAIIVGAIFTITRRNPVTAVVSLVATFFALAGLYATLSAHFLAILQILVYAGAIMVLFIFVVMILNREEISRVAFRGIVTRAIGVLAGAYIVYLGMWVVWRDAKRTPALSGPVAEPTGDFGTVAGVGASLFRDFVYPFEAISLLLLVAIVGGIIVSRSHQQEERAEETARRRREVQAMGIPESHLISGEEADAHGQHGTHAHQAAHH